MEKREKGKEKILTWTGGKGKRCKQSVAETCRKRSFALVSWGKKEEEKKEWGISLIKEKKRKVQVRTSERERERNGTVTTIPRKRQEREKEKFLIYREDEWKKEVKPQHLPRKKRGPIVSRGIDFLSIRFGQMGGRGETWKTRT